MIDKIVELGYPKREAEELIKVSSDIEKDYEKLLKKYPIQYLIGYVDFYGYKIIVNENVLIPRQETELLVDKVIKYSKNIFNKKVKILDLCTGSGAIGIVLSKELDSVVTASDICSKAIDVAKNNAKINNSNIEFIESDLFNNINDKFDIIVCNPPYISYNEEIEESVKLYEPNNALYAEDDGLFFYKKILNEISNYINDKYIIAFEIGCNQGNRLLELSKINFKNDNIFIEKDLSGKDRYLFVIHE